MLTRFWLAQRWQQEGLAPTWVSPGLGWEASILTESSSTCHRCCCYLGYSQHGRRGRLVHSQSHLPFEEQLCLQTGFQCIGTFMTKNLALCRCRAWIKTPGQRVSCPRAPAQAVNTGLGAHEMSVHQHCPAYLCSASDATWQDCQAGS